MAATLYIEQLRNLHDARYCAAVGIGMVGFNLDRSSDFHIPIPAVKEITAWLSGVECVGILGIESPLELQIKEDCENLSFLQIPFPESGEFEPPVILPIILDLRNKAMNLDLLDRVLRVNQLYPDGLFIFSRSSLIGLETDTKLEREIIMARSIFHFDDGSELLSFMELANQSPFGFSLGKFIYDRDGLIDYEVCDAFLDQYHALISSKSQL